jgi:hypothetical protein
MEQNHAIRKIGNIGLAAGHGSPFFRLAYQGFSFTPTTRTRPSGNWV